MAMARRVRLVKNSNDRSRKLVADSAERSRQQSGLDFLQRQRPHNLWLVSPGRGNDRPDSGKTQGKIIPREIISYDRRGSLVISLFAALCPLRLPFSSYREKEPGLSISRAFINRCSISRAFNNDELLGHD